MHLVLADLGREGLGQRAAKEGEILRELVNESTTDTAVAHDQTVAAGPRLVVPEIIAPVRQEADEFDEGLLVEDSLKALDSGELAPVRGWLTDKSSAGGPGG